MVIVGGQLNQLLIILCCYIYIYIAQLLSEASASESPQPGRARRPSGECISFQMKKHVNRICYERQKGGGKKEDCEVTCSIDVNPHCPFSFPYTCNDVYAVATRDEEDDDDPLDDILAYLSEGTGLNFNEDEPTPRSPSSPSSAKGTSGNSSTSTSSQYDLDDLALTDGVDYLALLNGIIQSTEVPTRKESSAGTLMLTHIYIKNYDLHYYY